jgi:hypothetical protein
VGVSFALFFVPPQVRLGTGPLWLSVLVAMILVAAKSRDKVFSGDWDGSSFFCVLGMVLELVIAITWWVGIITEVLYYTIIS